jgi:hypothetical protein
MPLTLDEIVNDLVRRCDEELVIDELIRTVQAMHKAGKDYGCGFYGEASWIGPYEHTRELAEKLAKLRNPDA